MADNRINTYFKMAFKRVDKNLRWVHFESAPWVNQSGATFVIYVVFADGNRSLNQFSLTTAEGTEIEAAVEKVGTLEKPLTQFNDLPDSFKDFFKVTFTLAKPELVIGGGEIGGESVPLFSLVPTIEYPGFLFDIVAQMAVALPDVAFKYLVETGTLYGHTAIHASRLFDKVYTVELDEKLHKNAEKLKARFPNVEFVRGDSGVEVGKLVDKLDSPAVFFLDAHWSGDNTVDWDGSQFGGFPTETSHLGESGTPEPSSAEQVPLDKEINSILNSFPHEALIIIDDWQSIGSKDYAFVGEDWTHLSKSQLIEQFKQCSRTLFQYPYDDKHYVVAISAS